MKNLLHKIKFVFALLLLINTVGKSQDKLSLKTALDKAKKDNLAIQKAKIGIRVTEADLARTKGLYLPKVQLSETFVATNDPLQSFGLLLKQEIVEQADFNPDKLNDPDVITNFNTRLDIQQPILNFDKMEEKKAVVNQIQAQNLSLKRTEEYILFEVKKTYYQLYLMRKSSEILQTALTAAQENARLIQDKLEQGYVQKADVLATQVRVLDLENQLKDIKKNEENTQTYLNFLLQNEENTSIVLSDSLKYEANIKESSAQISESRADFQAMKMGIEAQRNLLLAQNKHFLPNLNAFGAFEFNDDIPFGVEANNWLVGVRLQWNIFNGYDRIASKQKISTQIKESEIAYTQELKKSQLELSKAQQELKFSAEKLEVSKLAVTQAEEALRIRKNRFEQGLEKTSDLLNAEAMLAQQKLNHLQNVYAYNIAQFYVEFLLQQ